MVYYNHYTIIFYIINIKYNNDKLYNKYNITTTFLYTNTTTTLTTTTSTTTTTTTAATTITFAADVDSYYGL